MHGIDSPVHFKLQRDMDSSLVLTRKCPQRGHCLAPLGGPRAGKTQEVIPKFFKCISFTLNTCQETFISNILQYDLKLYSVIDVRTH